MINVSELSIGNTICVFIRHGEKDTERYCLTEKGKNEIIEFRKSLLLLKKQIQIYTSPESRCIETAVMINDFINEGNREVYHSEFLGKPGIQVKDEIAYTKLTSTMKCRNIFKEWKNGLHVDAMHSPKIIKSKTIEFFEKTALKNEITLYISQSGTVACTGYALGLVDYQTDFNDWVNYLDGYILRL